MFETALAGSGAVEDGSGLMRSARPAFVCGFAALCSLGGCLSGQTGSPECADPVSCVCDPLNSAGTLLRVRAERVDAGKLEAVVDEVFSTKYAMSNVVAGNSIAGSVFVERPCASDAASTLHVGEELFVLFSPGATSLDGVFNWAVPWGATLSFGASNELSSSPCSRRRKAATRNFPARPRRPAVTATAAPAQRHRRRAGMALAAAPCCSG